MPKADAQFKNMDLLRPSPNFVVENQGRSTGIPFPGSKVENGQEVAALDPDAGRAGYDPRLLLGHPVPMGSRILLWLPFIQAQNQGQELAADEGYLYTIYFRLRSLREYRNDRSRPYHVPRQQPGVPDTTLPADQTRVLVPCGLWIVAYQQPELDLLPPQLARAAVRTYPERIEPNRATGLTNRPSLPGGLATDFGVLQQGVLDPAVVGDLALIPRWHPFLIDALGDEMLITMDKVQDSAVPWDFVGNDAGVAQLYTAGPEFGIYVATGMMP